ncbi:hypothetical protein HDV05_007456 [Chytridiales sp. JEL 0842]|nr:hypothetical protein HDV05_007456 [Chytridiales sp. JEL 0842]
MHLRPPHIVICYKATSALPQPSFTWFKVAQNAYEGNLVDGLNQVEGLTVVSTPDACRARCASSSRCDYVMFQATGTNFMCRMFETSAFFPETYMGVWTNPSRPSSLDAVSGGGGGSGAGGGGTSGGAGSTGGSGGSGSTGGTGASPPNSGAGNANGASTTTQNYFTSTYTDTYSTSLSSATLMSSTLANAATQAAKPNSSGSGNNSSSAGQAGGVNIIAIVIPVISVLLVIAIVVAFFVVRKRQARSTTKKTTFDRSLSENAPSTTPGEASQMRQESKQNLLETGFNHPPPLQLFPGSPAEASLMVAPTNQIPMTPMPNASNSYTDSTFSMQHQQQHQTIPPAMPPTMLPPMPHPGAEKQGPLFGAQPVDNGLFLTSTAPLVSVDSNSQPLYPVHSQDSQRISILSTQLPTEITAIDSHLATSPTMTTLNKRSSYPTNPGPNIFENAYLEKKHPLSWTQEDVLKWLESKNVSKVLIQAVEELGVVGENLPHLTMEMLKMEMEGVKFGLRLSLYEMVQDLLRSWNIVTVGGSGLLPPGVSTGGLSEGMPSGSQARSQDNVLPTYNEL